MKQIELIVLLFVIVLYLWWRVKRRVAQVKANFRRGRKRPEPAEPVPGQLTLEKDP